MKSDIYPKKNRGTPYWLLQNFVRTLLVGLRHDLYALEEDGLPDAVCERVKPLLTDFSIIVEGYRDEPGDVGYVYRNIAEKSQVLRDEYLHWNHHENDSAYAPQRRMAAEKFSNNRRKMQRVLSRRSQTIAQKFDFGAFADIFNIDFPRLFGEVRKELKDAQPSNDILAARSLLENTYRLYYKNRKHIESALTGIEKGEI